MPQYPIMLPTLAIMPATAVDDTTRVFSSGFRVGSSWNPAIPGNDPGMGGGGVLYSDVRIALAGSAVAVNILFEAFRCRHGVAADRDTNPFFDQELPCTGLSAFVATFPFDIRDFGTGGIIALSAISAVSGWSATVDLFRYRVSG